MKSNRERALAKYLVSLFKMTLPGVDIAIHWLPKESSELGFTTRKKGKADVYLNRGTMDYIFNGLEDSKRDMFITGVAIHEFLHQILTNFIMFRKIQDTMKSKKEQWLFKEVFNILEDARIESFVAAYFSPSLVTALRFMIRHVWMCSPEINPESDVFEQLINAMIMYGDMYEVKPEMSSEAKEIFDKIVPLFAEAVDSVSCTMCLMKAKAVMEMLLPYAPEPPETDEKISPYATSFGESDSEGSDAETDDALESDDSKKDDGLLPGAESDSMTDTTESVDGDTEEVEDDADATEEDFEAAAKALEETLEHLEDVESKEAKAGESDYDFDAMERIVDDKFVKIISHHKASAAPTEYAKYRETVASDAHELAKLIERQFRTKPGKKKRSDHGDLNLMRYKDPNFKSPLIFDSKKPKSKHSAAVMLFVDESGSMGGSRIRNARLATAMLAEAMAEAGIPCCVVGHSGDSKYGCSVELEHYTTFKNALLDRESIPMISARCQNRDGPAIRWASSILRKRNEKKKLLIVISDGAPCANSYGGQSAIYDTKSAIRDAKRCHDVIGVVLEAGYATETLRTMYGEDFVECNSASNLKDCIAKIIKQKCKEW